MEVFFNNLVPDESATDKLLHDLSMAEEGAEELFAIAGENLDVHSREKFLTGVEKVKATCRNLQSKAVSGAKAADRAVREHPYSVAGIAFGVGLIIGAIALGRSNGAEDEES
jgi:ElaB/YqjD/DUF883 family membrane-anchored ribosome-binding protein